MSADAKIHGIFASADTASPQEGSTLLTCDYTPAGEDRPVRARRAASADGLLTMITYGRVVPVWL